MSKLIPLKNVNGELMVDSRIIAERLEVEHQSCFRLIKKFKHKFDEFGTLYFMDFKSINSGRGRPEKFTYLSESHAIFLLTLSKNSDNVVNLKSDLTKSFDKYKRAYIRQAANQGKLAWQQARIEGKVTRRTETDTIKEFVDYATAQGSQRANTYYMNISKMVNKSLFFVDEALGHPKNFRDLLGHTQLTQLDTADNLVFKILRESMQEEIYYKDVYKLAKEKVESLAAIIGKTDVLEQRALVGV